MGINKTKNSKTRKVSSLLRKMMEGKNLTANEAKTAFTTIIKEDKNTHFITAFLAIMSTKGATGEELYGLSQAVSEFYPKLNKEIDTNIVTDLSGTGGAKIKTINVSTAASFIVAAAGFKVAKQAFPGITSPTGSADIFHSLGIEVFKINLKQIKDVLEKIGLVPYNIVFGLTDKLGVIRKFGRLNIQKLKIVNSLHLIMNLLSPIQIRRRAYGVFNVKYLEVIAELFQRRGYIKGIIYYGLDGLCEVSNIGPTKIIEIYKKKSKSYTVRPNDFGIKKSKYEDIKAISPKQNVIDFLRILYGRERGSKRDIVLINAAVALYTMDKVENFVQGTKLAAQILEEGLAFKKLEQLVNSLGSKEQLEFWKKKAGLS